MAACEIAPEGFRQRLKAGACDRRAAARAGALGDVLKIRVIFERDVDDALGRGDQAEFTNWAVEPRTGKAGEHVGGHQSGAGYFDGAVAQAADVSVTVGAHAFGLDGDRLDRVPVQRLAPGLASAEFDVEK